jgi:hypothetical protein
MKTTGKRTKRASAKQESEIATSMGGRRQPGSGAIPGLKGDVRVKGKLRIEAKYTSNKSYSVTRADLLKIRSECYGSETPAFVIDFKDPGTLRTEERWVLIPFSDWENLVNAATVNQ